MTVRKSLSAAACMLVMSMPALAHQRPQWVATFASSPAQMPDDVAIRQIRAAYPELNSADPAIIRGTIRYRLRIAQGGRIIRLTISNPSAQPLLIGKMSVGIAGRGLDAVGGTMREVHFGGAGRLLLPADAPALSDPIDLPVEDGADLVISVYLPDGIRHWDGASPSPATSPAVAADLDRTASDPFPVSFQINQRPLVSRIDVSRTHARKVVVAFGDSITDGIVAPNGARGWPGALAHRLAARNISVVNAGIGGNRLLRPAGTMQPAALARLARDVWSVPGITHIITLLGINDIGMGGLAYPGFGESAPVDADEIIAAYKQIIAQAHDRGIKVIGATILPFQGARYYAPEKDATRRAVNTWIRTSKAFDAIVDFDAITRDPAMSGTLRREFDSGDHLHLNTAGYTAMGEMIDLRVFEGD